MNLSTEDIELLIALAGGLAFAYLAEAAYLGWRERVRRRDRRNRFLKN